MSLKGKGYYIWRIPWTEKGNLQSIVDLAKEANLGHVLIKIADGDDDYNIDKNTGQDLVPPLLDLFRQAGITAWGWQYVYGRNAQAEAAKAIQRVRDLELPGFVVNAEKEFKFQGMDEVATDYMKALRKELDDIPVALSSYRFPSSHPSFRWKIFMEYSDMVMPQVYWQDAHNPVSQLVRSVCEFQDFIPFRPIVPTGAAYPVGSWAPTSHDVEDFLTAVQELGMGAANFWSWEHCRRFIPHLWDTIRDHPWPLELGKDDIAYKYIETLNTGDPLNPVLLYQLNGVHITAAEVAQGPEKLLAWYNTFLKQTLPDGVFHVTEVTGEGNTRHIQWTAESSKGRVLNGKDTLGLLGGKINFHYTFFDVVQDGD